MQQGVHKDTGGGPVLNQRTMTYVLVTIVAVVLIYFFVLRR